MRLGIQKTEVLTDNYVILEDYTLAKVPAGLLLQDKEGWPVVACGEGYLKLLEVTPAGSKLMSGKDWLSGKGKELLGTIL